MLGWTLANYALTAAEPRRSWLIVLAILLGAFALVLADVSPPSV